MFNYGAIDKTPTVRQVQAIIEYMVNDPDNRYNFDLMMEMSRSKPHLVTLNLNNAGMGYHYEIEFNEQGEIVAFERGAVWMS